MLGLDNPIHLLFLGVLLLLVFGAKRLPEMGHSLGAGLRGFRDSLSADSHTPAISDHAARYVAGASAPTAETPASDVRHEATGTPPIA
jgi:sec-independent protein translocase protein TatA